MPIEKRDTSWMIHLNGATHRGETPMNYQPLRVGRDLTGEVIARHLGEERHGYRLTAEQVEQRRTGRGPSSGLPYEYLIYSPGSYGTSWTAFYTRAELGAWLDAYALQLDHEPEPGASFRVKLPPDASGWQPLH